MQSKYFSRLGARQGERATHSIHTTPDSDQLLSAGMNDMNHALPAKDFLTVDELCELFGLARITVNGWLQTGELPHYRLGPRTIRISRADLDAFLAERRLTGMPGRLGEDGRLIEDDAQVIEVDRPEKIRSKHSAPAESDSRTAAA
jgi:excisionase family DNA binding protein